MKTKLIPLIVTILAIPASQAATTFSFSTLRFTQNGSVVGGAESSFIHVENTLETNGQASDVTASYILTADFDGDTLADTLTFGLTATAFAPTGSNVSVNSSGVTGVAGPGNNFFIGEGQAINYTVSVGSVVTSTGAGFAASFDGFTGGSIGSTDEGDSYNANGEVFTGSTFDFDSTGTLVPSETLLLTGVSGAVFSSGVDFGITVEEVPEPSSTALLGLGALGFLVRRRR